MGSTKYLPEVSLASTVQLESMVSVLALALIGGIVNPLPCLQHHTCMGIAWMECLFFLLSTVVYKDVLSMPSGSGFVVS